MFCFVYLLTSCVALASSGNEKPKLPVATSLERLITSFDEEGLEHLVSSLPAGQEHDLAAGVVASRTNRLAAADALLARVLGAKPGRASYAAIAREYLALNAALQGRYARAAVYGRQLLAASGTAMHGSDLDDFKEQLMTWEVLRQAPAQVVSRPGPTTLPLLPTTWRIQATVLANGVAAVGLFDTGAPMTVISQRLATQLHLVPLPGRAYVTGSTNAQNPVQIALLEKLALGTVLLEQVPVTILADSALLVGPLGHQTLLDMIVGYSVLRALHTFSVAHGRLVLGGPVGAATVVGRIVERGNTSILLARFAGEPANFFLDTGARSTFLTRAFYQRHTQLFSRLAPINKQFSGVGGTTHTLTYTLPSLELALQKGHIQLPKVTVLPNASALDVQGLIGNLGHDINANSDKFALDFTRGKLHLTYGEPTNK